MGWGAVTSLVMARYHPDSVFELKYSHQRALARETGFYLLRQHKPTFQGLLRGVLHARPKVRSSGYGPLLFLW